MKNARYSLRCMAPDGATVREGEFATVQNAWDRSCDMGSRWFFYPIHLVTGSARSDLARIKDVPCGMDSEWKGKSVRALARALKANPEHACDYCNGETPLCLFP